MVASGTAVEKSVFSNPFADIDMQPVQVAGEDVAKVAVRVKDDKGEYRVAGILGKDYTVYKNSLVRDVVSDIMTRSGMLWKNLKTLWDGKKYIDYFHTEEPITAIKNGATYPLHLGMMARNSYDGSSKLGLEFFIMNQICANQYIARKQMGYFAIRHTGDNGFDVNDALQNISEGATRLTQFAPRLEHFISQDLTVADITAAANADLIPASHWGTALSTLDKEVDAGKIFGLYQALTFVTSHKMQGFTAIGKGDEITNYFFNKY
jgi:hypothetical protein